jgi:CYTH domain-containing protein
MATEIERKFLLANDDWRKLASGTVYRQGYLCADENRTVRVRVIGDKGFLTIKGKSVGISRMEYEYEIPVADAETLIEELCAKPFIEKKRYRIEYKGFLYEVDEFFSDNEGLVVAEIELTSETQKFVKPSWLGREVSDDNRYFNASLVKHPYSCW